MCVSTPRMYPRSGYFLFIYLNQSNQDQESGPPLAFIGAKSQMMSIASRFWSDNPFTVQPKQHEEINVIVKPEENIKHDYNCEDDSAIEAFDECVRLQTEANIYNSSFAERFCDASDVFGNCTIPQVI